MKNFKEVIFFFVLAEIHKNNKKNKILIKGDN